MGDSGRGWCLPLGLLLTVACGSNGGNGGNGSAAPGQVTQRWEDFCVATFERAQAVVDAFGHDLFTARAGERYLMGAYETSVMSDHAGLIYLTPDGPATFDIDAPLGTRDFPFTASCEFDHGVRYYAAFSDVSVFDSADLTHKLCDLTKGSVVPLDETLPSGYSLTGLTLSGPTTYQVILNAFSESCSGAQSGFVSVPQTSVFGAETWLVPVISIIGPV